MMSPSSGTALFVVGHGTKSLRGTQQFSEVVAKVQKLSPMPVAYGFIELATPTVATAISELVATHNPERIVLLPLLLLAAGHMKSDIPSEIFRAKVNHPGVEFVSARDLAINADILKIIEERTLAPFNKNSTNTIHDEPGFTLLVGRGSSDAGANSDLYKITRLLIERRRIGQVEPAFISLTEPNVPSSLDRCKMLGATNITITPYFLFDGALLQRIYAQALQWGQGNPDITVSLAREIGSDERIASILIARAHEREFHEERFSSCHFD